MNAWFSPEVARLLSMLSLLSLLALVAPWVKRGQFRSLVTSSFLVALGIGFVFLGASIVARFVEQPQYVITALTLTGILVTVAIIVTLPVVHFGYLDAERRKILAKDI